MISDDIRLGDIIVEDDSGDIILIGFPYDEGVRRNNGRVGAKLGPDSFRQLLIRTGTVVNAEYDDLDIRNYLKISDGGNINSNLTLEEAHQQLEERIRQLISRGKISFVVAVETINLIQMLLRYYILPNRFILLILMHILMYDL